MKRVKGLSKKIYKIKNPHRHRQQYGDYQRESGVEEVEEGVRGINGDRRRSDF